jgi:PadR family transcriptional regulator, regulatory protein PadR
MHSKELLKGTLITIILKVLADHGKMYGYEIAQHVKDLSERTINLTEGALYPTLHKMELDGLVSTEVVHIGRRVRKYYSLTTEGQRAAHDKVQEFTSFIKTMAFVLNIKLT